MAMNSHLRVCGFWKRSAKNDARHADRNAYEIMARGDGAHFNGVSGEPSRLKNVREA